MIRLAGAMVARLPTEQEVVGSIPTSGFFVGKCYPQAVRSKLTIANVLLSDVAQGKSGGLISLHWEVFFRWER